MPRFLLTSSTGFGGDDKDKAVLGTRMLTALSNGDKFGKTLLNHTYTTFILPPMAGWKSPIRQKNMQRDIHS